MKRGFTIENLMYCWFSNDLILIYEYSGAQYSGTKMARYDGKTFRKKWSARLPGFNAGTPLIYKENIYSITL